MVENTLPIKPPAPSWSGHGIEPTLYLRFFGMQRAGNHAVIDGILRNCPSHRSVFLNNCGSYKKPFQSFGRLVVNGQIIAPDVIEKEGLRPLLAPAAPNPVLAISYENTVLNSNEDRQISGNFHTTLFHRNFFILRSFTNWYASYVALERRVEIHYRQTALEADSRILKSIRQYVDFLAETQRQQNHPTIRPIHFDRWYQDATYRADIMTEIGFQVNDLSLGEIQKFGVGSSFSLYREAPENLDLSGRWKLLLNNRRELPLLAIASRDHDLRRLLAHFFPEDLERLDHLTQAFT